MIFREVIKLKEENKVGLIDYPRQLDISFCVSHAAGAAFGIAALIISLVKTGGSGSALRIACAAVYCLSFIAVYGISALYHGLPPGRAKVIARRLDHIAIPVLLAGTATPCALITLYRISHIHGITVFCAGWAIALYGLAAKLFFFNNEKLKTLGMVIYFAGGAAMLLSAVPLLGTINRTAFILLVLGCILYGAGAVFCRMGIKKPAYHLPFHILVLAGSIVQFVTVYHYVL
jgi:hemolysin III